MCTSLLALAVFLSSLVAQPSTADEFRDEATGIEFPASLGSLARGDLTRYEPAESGFSVRYTGRNDLKADVYVYTAGVANLGTGETKGVVLSHLAEVKQAVFAMEAKGRYKNVKLVSEGEVSLNTAGGPVPLLHTVLQYSDDAGPRISHIYLGTYQDHFFKIRLTYLAKYRTQGENALRLFVGDCEQLLK